MKYIFSFTTLLFLLLSCTDKKKGTTSVVTNVSIDSLRNDGSKLAEEDLKKGIIGYYFVGIATPPCADILERDYGIIIHDEGCNATGIESGYNKIMRQAIIKKFGRDLIALECEQTPMFSPKFKGGDVGLRKFILENVNYPSSVDTLQGQVVLSLIIDSTGRITSYKVIKSLNPIIDSECTRVLRIMPKWIPATTKSGEKIAANVILPIIFENK
jgi:hypothetical protein